MVLIRFTNVVVDDFNRKNTVKPYIYFLTHFHSDHYSGLTNNWDYGQIFCTESTKILLQMKFPKVTNIITRPLNETFEISLGKDYNIKVTFFDANHCIGSVMILFQGYFGNILHTGDMRYSDDFILKNPILYPPELRCDKSEFDGCSINIDELILDNTFCDPVFRFPDRKEAFRMLCEIIDLHPDHRVLLCVDSVGKEELMIDLAVHYETLIVVNEQKFQMIQALNLMPQLFTTNHDEGWIEVIRKHDRIPRLAQNEKAISIIATGWGNTTVYRSTAHRNYIIPYSLHSNYEEIYKFVRSIRPGLMEKVVKNKANKMEDLRSMIPQSNDMVSLMKMKQQGFDYLVNRFQDLTKLSESFLKLLNSPDLQDKINCDLIYPDLKEQTLINQTMFENQHKNVYSKKKQKGVKIGQFDKDPQKIVLEAQEEFENIKSSKNQDKNECVIIEKEYFTEEMKAYFEPFYQKDNLKVQEPKIVISQSQEKEINQTDQIDVQQLEIRRSTQIIEENAINVGEQIENSNNIGNQTLLIQQENIVRTSQVVIIDLITPQKEEIKNDNQQVQEDQTEIRGNQNQDDDFEAVRRKLNSLLQRYILTKAEEKQIQKQYQEVFTKGFKRPI